MIAPGDDHREGRSRGQGSKGFGQKLPLRRHGSADEIGKGCVFFMSELASYVTGAYLPITCGRVTQMGA